MKKLVLILLFFSFCQIGFVQGLLSYVKWEADSQGPEKFDRIAIDLSWNQWQKVPNNITQGYFSFGFSSSWFKDLPLGQKSNCAIALGLGFESMSFHHNGTLTTVQNSNSSSTQLTPFETDSAVLRNKYAVNYIDFPFEFRIRTINKTLDDRMKFNFKLYLGFKVGVLVNDHTKYKDNNIKIKTFNIPNRLPYRFGPYVRIGFNKIGFVGYYSLSSIFQDGSVELKPFSIGLSWMRF